MLDTILDFSEEDVCKEGGFLEKQFDMDITLPIEDLKLLSDDFFSFNEIELLFGHRKQNDFKFAESLPKKPRSKRVVGGRTWSLSLPLPLDGGSVSSTMKRRCSHCQADNTPQWRVGPMGPKTLCNACGLRYRSGQLVPEYRPAASPTFVTHVHSNSHRKIMSMRRERGKLCR